jgi:YXWGXW repeat-containing protein
MNSIPRTASHLKTRWIAPFLAATLVVAGCHNNQDQNTAANQPAQDQGTDPAAANLAPATYTTPGTPSSDAAQSAGSQSYSTAPPDDSDYSEPATETAAEAPPPLPDYQQPPDPGDGYIWTPGYWNYASTGYYWVPGAWVAPPYQGALWTPGYWANTSGRYAFHPGHWGTHIGFYGGVNYGFGYGGLGYEGGYWNKGHFTYNTVYNNVNRTVIHNTYTYNVNHVTEVSHTSFNGGHDGVQVRPRPQEVVARQEPYAPRMNTQVQHAESFRTDHNQFATVNHGQPPNVAVTRPIEADPNVHPLPPKAHPVAPVSTRPGTAPHVQPGRPTGGPKRPAEERPR